MIVAAMIALLISMGIVVLRGIMGPTVYDRILTANSFGTYTVVAVALLGFLTHTMFFLDIAMTYALINFLSTIALLRYFRYGTFGER